MTPSELRKEALKVLRETRSAMSKPEFLLRIERLPADKRKTAAWLTVRVQLAYLKLRTAELAEIRDGLVENEKALKSGIHSLKKALKDLGKVQAILKAAGGFLGVVGRLVALV